MEKDRGPGHTASGVESTPVRPGHPGAETGSVYRAPSKFLPQHREQEKTAAFYAANTWRGLLYNQNSPFTCLFENRLCFTLTNTWRCIFMQHLERF